MSGPPDRKVLTTIELAKAFDEGIQDSNKRRHRGLKTTPFAVWRTDPTPVERVMERHIALALMRREPVTVTRSGVELGGITYQGKATFIHVGDELEAGWLATRPDFIDLFDARRPKGDQWLGRLEPVTSVSDKLATAIKKARAYQIETVERADRRANELRAERAAQLRGGVVEVPGAPPTPSKRGRRGRAEGATGLEERRKRVAASGVWKDDQP